MIGKSIGAILAVVTVGLQSNKRYGTSALRSSFLTRTVHSGLMSMMIGGRPAIQEIL